jgi:mono/diheme cytochrome c family protein
LSSDDNIREPRIGCSDQLERSLAATITISQSVKEGEFVSRVLAAAWFLLAACGCQPAGSVGDASAIYRTRCAACHGIRGDGKGPSAPQLKPQPRDYTDPQWQKTVTDEHIERAILEGGAAVGKSVAMPPHPDLKGRPDVVTDLRQMIRDFAKEKGD